jgi:transposase
VAADPRIDLWSSDECHFQQHGTRCRMWVPPEDKDPVLLHAPTRKSVACFGAVSVRAGKLVTLFEPKFNAESFQRFLQLLLKHRACRKRLVLVLDNARYHHARALQPWLRQHRKLLTLLFLPPYSPELNPIERVWKLTRRLATHNRHFPTLDDILNAVTERFRLWIKPTRQLVKLCVII